MGGHGPRRLALRGDHRPGHEPRGDRARARLPPRVPLRPRDRRALQRAVALRDRPGRPVGLRRARDPRGRRRRRAGLRGIRHDPVQQRALARAGARRARPARPRQADARRPGAHLVLRPLGRAAHRRVAGQARQGRAPRRGRAARGARGLRGRPCLRPAARPGGARRRAGRGDHGAGAGGPPRPAPDRPRALRPRPDHVLRRVRHRGGGLGARRQPVRPARRPGREGRHEARARGGCARHRGGRPRGAARAARRRPAGVPGAAGLRRPGRRDRRGRRRAAPRDPRPHADDDHVRLRPPLPALDRSAAQGRSAGRPVPAAPARAVHRRARAGRPRTASRPCSGPRPTATC